ncbi:MAG TPA: hypothetical protein VGL98_13195 [Gammaproteobacteria bacterium]
MSYRSSGSRQLGRALAKQYAPRRQRLPVFFPTGHFFRTDDVVERRHRNVQAAAAPGTLHAALREARAALPPATPLGPTGGRFEPGPERPPRE